MRPAEPKGRGCDLVERLAKDRPLSAPDFATFYTPGRKGDTDCPTA